jgi:hypothetical protein
MKIRPEQQLCKSLMQYVALWKMQKRFRGLILHIPNNQSAGKDVKARKIAGAVDKAMGLRPGAADYLAINPRGEVLFLEAKSDVGRQKPNQKEFELEVRLLKCRYEIFRTTTEAAIALFGHAMLSDPENKILSCIHPKFEETFIGR